MSEDSFKARSLRYHREPSPGKLAIKATKPMATQHDLALAYSPGVAHACDLIAEDDTEAANMTARGNLVAVITNGTAVLGLGNTAPWPRSRSWKGRPYCSRSLRTGSDLQGAHRGHE